MLSQKGKKFYSAFIHSYILLSNQLIVFEIRKIVLILIDNLRILQIIPYHNELQDFYLFKETEKHPLLPNLPNQKQQQQSKQPHNQTTTKSHTIFTKPLSGTGHLFIIDNFCL